MAIGVSFIICIAWTLIAPQKDGNYDAYKTIQLEDCEDLPSDTEDPMAMNRALKVKSHCLHCCRACPADVPPYLLRTPWCDVTLRRSMAILTHIGKYQVPG